MRAKKSLGQHFLTSPRIAERIVSALTIDPDTEAIVEIGPGRGILTDALIKRSEQLVLIEKDADLIDALQSTYAAQGAVVVEIDFLKADLDRLIRSKQFHLIGNFPYNISSQIVFKMLDNKSRIPQMVGMFQKEVALRLAAPHGSRTYGILSVLLQIFYDVEILFHLSPQAFTPPPKVQSSVIRCTRKPGVHMSMVEEKMLRKVVKLAFGQRRKMLRNALHSILPEASVREDVAAFMTKRAEQLAIGDFVELSRSLQPKS